MRLLGVDIGGVIIEPADDDEDTSFFGPNYLHTPPVLGAFDALAALGGAFDAVHLVSKCGEDTSRRTLEWLAHHDFAGRTGIGPDRVHFCRTRAEKGPIAADLGLTHFVDDKLEVLGYLTTVAHRYLFRTVVADPPAGVVRVAGWPELVALLR
jgi:hypothetical protein